MNELGIEITSVCSFNCYFCGKQYRENHTLSTEVFKRVVDEALELGYDSFVLTPKNGDIFCDKDVYSKLEYLKIKKVPYYFFTNLHLADPKELMKVISPVSKIYYSEYGKSDDEFEKLTRRPRSFRHTVLKNYNTLSTSVIKQERNKGYMVSMKSRPPKPEVIETKFCTQACHHSVSSNGDVILCTCGTYNPDLVVGNIIDDTLKNVFTSDFYRDKIRQLMKNGMNNSVCRERCSNFSTLQSPKQMLRNMRL